jgi:hypothetical protein
MNGRTQSVTTTFTSLGALHAYLNQLHDDDGRWQMANGKWQMANDRNTNDNNTSDCGSGCNEGEDND